MEQQTIQRLSGYGEFCALRGEWEEFTDRCFPSNYSRTFTWLASWWETYLGKGPAIVYLVRDAKGRICAAAPCYSRWEMFGGLPLRMLHVIGHGIGTDDLLVPPGAEDGARLIFNKLLEDPWHVARFRRLRNDSLFSRLLEAADAAGSGYATDPALDYLVTLPGDFSQYLQSRRRKFRRNLCNAENKLKSLGEVEFAVLDPYRDAARVQEAGALIARTSWQYRQGLSHFNERNRTTLYSSLAGWKKGAGGEEFNLLLVDGRPAAYLLGCRRQQTYYAIDTAFAEDLRQVSVGRVLLSRVIERLIREGEVREFDFEGGGEYKDQYANSTLPVTGITFYGRSAYAQRVKVFRDSPLFRRLKGKGAPEAAEKVEEPAEEEQ